MGLNIRDRSSIALSLRPGAGRKPNYLKRLGIKAITAAEILAHVDEVELWLGLPSDKNYKLQALQYLTDRRDGKAKQAVQVSGALLHAHTAYRDPKLAKLSPEELANQEARATLARCLTKSNPSKR